MKTEQSMSFELLEAYFSRNRRWLMPALAALIVAGTSNISTILDPSIAGIFPKWLVPAAGALGCFGSGFGAHITDTASARVITYLGSAVGVAIVAAWIFA